MVGLIVGLVGLGVGSLNRIWLVEVMRWRWRLFWKNVRGGLIVVLITGLGVELITRQSSGLGFVLGGWLIAVLSQGALGGLTYKVKGEKALPNEGIKLSRKN